MKQIIDRGAEAILIKQGKNLIKDRIKKSYRLPIIDERLRKQRTKKESRLLIKTSKLIPVPKLIKSDDKEKIEMEFINGKKLSDNLGKLKNADEVCKKIGENIAKLHDNNIVHGDLTTSNMIYSNDKVYFIDFGLSFESSKIEDRAVDLHLIKQALEAKHFDHYNEFFKAILEGYKQSKDHKLTLKRLEAVEKRGRYKRAY
ncbi:Kae1-associated serine/threonine protein kinase [Candidatus Pacearchaeota archaeon]|nr:Kae1-associated serine/threonine protein kinase [Candidatus Pacearchaeota archaeon]